MDGNNRWAKERGLSSTSGHEEGANRVRDVLDQAELHDIDVVTLFAFSSENWKRPELEVRALMTLLSAYLKKEVKNLIKRNVRLQFIGRRDNFTAGLLRQIKESEAATAKGARVLVLAVDYGGRWEIAEAAKKVAKQVQSGRMRPDDIDESALHQHMSLSALPPPDLCIRTAGEQRISNFLLWHFAYSEFYFADCYWPDFGAEAFDSAVAEYYTRQRRFGLRDEQVNGSDGRSGAR